MDETRTEDVAILSGEETTIKVNLPRSDPKDEYGVAIEWHDGEVANEPEIRDWLIRDANASLPEGTKYSIRVKSHLSSPTRGMAWYCVVNRPQVISTLVSTGVGFTGQWCRKLIEHEPMETLYARNMGLLA